MKQTIGMLLIGMMIAMMGCDNSGKQVQQGSQAGENGGNATPAAATIGGSGTVSLTGAGATFPAPLYQKWIAEFTKSHPNLKIGYQAVGSGSGIKQITDRGVDFGASDGPMTDEQLSKAPGLLHIPMTMGAVVPIYNAPGVDKTLTFTGELLADIFLGKITQWNDPRIAGANPGVNLPNAKISCVYRSDGSGTTYIFTDYLSKLSREWSDGPGKATTVKWPRGVGAKGSDGVAGTVQKIPGSLGYVELIYALANNIPYGDVINAAGKPIHATEQAVSAAAATVTDIAPDLRVSITNAPGDQSYPISSFTWILIYQEQKDPAKAKALLDFLSWATHDGQAMSSTLHYAPLPEPIVQLVDKKLKSVTADGKPVLR